MIYFKNDYSQSLPYNQYDYCIYLIGEEETQFKWFGMSIQNLNCKDDNDCKLKSMADVFKTIINEFDDGNTWIINHDRKDMPWFPELEKDVKLPKLREIFRQNKISESFIGAIVATKNIILDVSSELASYPFLLSYQNIDVSHEFLPVIIKLTDHLSVDIISTENSLLERIEKKQLPVGLEIVKYMDDLT